MESDWAAEHLQTIRTLMERSAVYRRALAPIMIFAGATGLVAMGAGLGLDISSSRGFCVLWFAAAAVAVAGAVLIARRQALRDHEPFWSPPTCRVAQALLPPLTAGMCLGFVFVFAGLANTIVLTFIWLLFYGCALHAAGFFMPRGVKLFGWIYIGLACGSLFFLGIIRPEIELNAHWLMGLFFGVLHLIYGVYLYWTERRTNAA